jgi:hypothetical protein
MKRIKNLSLILFLFLASLVNAQIKQAPNYFGEDTFMTLIEEHDFNKVFYVSSYDIIVVQQIYINVSGRDKRVIHLGQDINKNGILETNEVTKTEFADLNYSNNLQEPVFLGSMGNDGYLQEFYLIHKSYDNESGNTTFSVVEYNAYDSDGNGEISRDEIIEDRQYEYPERNGFTGWGS